MSSRSHRPSARFPSEPTLDGQTDESELPLIEPDEDATPVDASRKRSLGMATDPGDHTPTRHNPMGQDAALKPSYSGKEVPDPGHKPAFLYVDRGPGAGQLIPLKQGSVVVGRISSADLRINHPSVSRQHAQLSRRGEEFTVEDLGSQNGTYVNRRRVRGPTHVLPGDEITVGTALLKLRGSGESLTHVPAARGSRSPLSNAVKVALFAGAVGAGIAATLVYAFVHMQAAPAPQASEPAPVAAATAAASEAAEPSSRRMVIEDEPVVVDVVKGKPAAPSAAVAAESMPAAPAPVAAAPAPRPAAAPKVSATAAAARRAAESSDTAAEKEAAEEAPAASDDSKNPARANILARYETGKVDAAIEAAEAAGDKALLADLVKFRDAFNAAKESSDVATAIRQFTVAQKVDDKLSAGWSSYGSQIKKQLGGLYARVGAHYAEAGNTAEARKAFQLALKQEPGNAAAKAGLAELGDGEKKAAPKRADIEDAFAE